MKKYAVDFWRKNKNNPFKERVPLWEAPVSEPMPDAPPETGIPAATSGVEEPGGPNMPDDQDFNPETGMEKDSEQPGMDDMGSVNSEPDIDNMDDENESPIDFETEKIDYMNLALQRKNEEMMDKLLEMREIDNLSSGQYKFIEDNIQILSLSRDVDFADLQKKVYKQIKEKFQELAEEEQEENPGYGDMNTEEPTQPEQPAQSEQPPEIPQEPDMEMAHYDMSKNLKGIVFSEAPIDAPPEGGPFVPGGEISTAEQPPSDFAPTFNDEEGEQDNTPQANTNDEEDDDSPEFLANMPGEPEDFEEEDNELGDISGTELFSIISSEIEQYTTVTESIIKLSSFYSMKADLFRKIIASITNGVQIGSGGRFEDIFIPISENGVGIKVCTRIYTMFGNIQIGKWNLEFNDPEKYLSDSELEKLNYSGSPEEKEVLRKRTVIESVSQKFKDKVYIAMVVDPSNGERHEMSFNFSNILKQGWQDGFISVDFKANVGKGKAGVKVDGTLIDLQDIVISYIKENPDRLDSEGLPVKEHVDFLKLKDGFLYLVIDQENFESLNQKNVDGLFYATKPYDKDERSLKNLQKCIPDIKELLLKQC